MEFKGLKKVNEGRFITRYDLDYETVDGKPKTYEMISRRSDLAGKLPEKGRKFGIYDEDDGFLREYYVAQSSCDLGMVRLELEAIDE